MAAATAVSLCLLAGGVVAVTAVSSRSPSVSPNGAVSTDADSSIALPTTSGSPRSTTSPDTAVASSDSTTTTENPGFVDGAAASLAAEELITSYVESQYGVAVTDPACSEPPSGAPGDEFVCYALKPGDLVIALRATIGEDRLVSLDLVTNQEETTTSVAPETTEA